MDERFQVGGITFVWSLEKAASNLRRHGVPFEEAAQAFFDPFLKVVDASRRGEARDAILGMDKAWRLLYVVHLEIQNEHVRVISARKATRQEWTMYED